MALHIANDTETNLCDTCMLHPVECGTDVSEISFGNGPGNDNVVACTNFHNGLLKMERDRIDTE